MLGIDPITASALFVLAGGIQCPDHAPTKINIVPKTEEVEIDSSQTLKEIQGYSMDTVDPYSFHGQTVTQGFMKGTIGLRHKIKYGEARLASQNLMCVWYDTITIELKIDPTIVIAKELYRDRCMRKAILGHELKHVRVDREIVNKYAKSIGNKIYKALEERGFSAGPFMADQSKEVADKMQRVVHQIVELEYQKLDIDRRERQRAVDSREEYNKVGALCPSFNKRKNRLYDDLQEDLKKR